MNITTNLDGEQVTIINVTGDESSESIVYIDSSNNIKVKNVPLDWSRKLTISTGAVSTNIIKSTNYFAAPQCSLAAQNPIAAAFGFTERFKVPSRENSKCVGFDVCWMNGGSENSILSASKWSIATSLTGSSVQINPLDLKLSGSVISNAIVPRGLGGSQPEVTDLLISDFVNVSLSAGQIIEVRSNLASGANHTYNKSMRGTGDYYILSAGNFQEMYSCENTGVVGATGNCINGNPSVTCVIGGWLYGICFVRFYFELGSTSVLMCGDSVVQGIAGVSGEDGYGNISPLSIAAQLDPRISPLVFAHGNYFSSGSQAAQIKLIKTLKPSITLIWAWSPNDNISNIDVSINNAISVAQKAYELGSVAAMCTPIPWGYSGADLLKFTSAVNRVRNICKNTNIILVDVCLYLEDPNNPGSIRAEYKGTATNGQEKHPGPLGKQVFAQCIVNSLAKVI